MNINNNKVLSNMKNKEDNKPLPIKKTYKSNPGAYQDFYDEITHPEFLDNLKDKDYPIGLKNWLLTMNFALTVLNYTAVEFVHFSISNEIVYSGGKQEHGRLHIIGEICFRNRSSLMPYDKPALSPSVAGYEFKGYPRSLYRDNLKKFQDSIQEIPLNESNNDGTPKTENNINIHVSRNRLEADLLKCFDNNYYQYASYMKQKIQEQIDSVPLQKSTCSGFDNFKI